MESKTPVTLLQELLLKKGTTPDYVLVHNGVGTHDPLFVYEVSALGKTAVGSGKSKREAKHAAAQEMLHALNPSEREGVPVLEEIQSPYADILKDNAVGALQDFCCQHKLSAPVYEQTRDEGLPHAKLFGMRCRVSNLSTVAEARTKKQAKQIASLSMLQKLKMCLKDETLGEYSVDNSSSPCDSKLDLDERSVKKVVEVLDREIKVPLGTPLDHYELILKDDIYPSSEVLERIKGGDEAFFNSIQDPLAEFENLTNQLGMSWDKRELKLKSDQDKLVSIQIESLNYSTFFGRGDSYDTALKEAALSALKWFAVMAL